MSPQGSASSLMAPSPPIQASVTGEVQPGAQSVRTPATEVGAGLLPALGPQTHSPLRSIPSLLWKDPFSGCSPVLGCSEDPALSQPSSPTTGPHSLPLKPPPHPSHELLRAGPTLVQTFWFLSLRVCKRFGPQDPVWVGAAGGGPRAAFPGNSCQHFSRAHHPVLYPLGAFQKVRGHALLVEM